MDPAPDRKTKIFALVTGLAALITVDYSNPESIRAFIEGNSAQILVLVFDVLAVTLHQKIDREGRRAERDPNVPRRRGLLG